MGTNLKALILIIIVLISGVVVSVPLGKGCIIKHVTLDGDPLEGAYVALGQRCHGYTDQDGEISFCNLPYGTYYLYVDYDNDGVWDTDGEEVLLDQATVHVYNDYLTPKNSMETATKKE